MFDDQREWLAPIDEMVTEDRQELDRIYDRFQVNGRCRCPLCKSLEIDRGERKYVKSFRRSCWQTTDRNDSKE